MSDIIKYKPIGIIRTPFEKSEGMPIQPKFSNVKGKVILKKNLADGLGGLEEFSHIILLYHFHEAKKVKLRVKPFLSTKEMGLFAIRAPNRPNPIGLSIVKLLKIIETEDNVELVILGADMLDKTPLLDIKPYVTEFDSFPEAKNGWFDERDIDQTTADNRFSKQ
jgi:tRNA-Thr(GGU) m(6)t(6)A37 methyltransferase TsaA